MLPEILMIAPMQANVIEGIGARFLLHRLWEQAEPEAYLANIAPRIRGLAANTLAGPVTPALLDTLPTLEIIASFGVGYEHIDAADAARRGIIVTNTPGVLDDEVADLAIGLLLATVRRLPQADRFVREGRWEQGAFPLSPTLRGRRIGLLGFGNIGKAIARRLEGFGVAIAYHARHAHSDTPYAHHATPAALAAASDVLIVVVPGGAATRDLVDAEVLEALGPDGILINIARGSVVDETALIQALDEGIILGAGLDVFADEPHVPPGLIAHPNVVLLPHVGSASHATRAAMGQLVVDNLIGWFERRAAVTPVQESKSLARPPSRA